MSISPFSVVALVAAALVTPYFLIGAAIIEVFAAGIRSVDRQPPQ